MTLDAYVAKLNRSYDDFCEHIRTQNRRRMIADGLDEETIVDFLVQADAQMEQDRGDFILTGLAYAQFAFGSDAVQH